MHNLIFDFSGLIFKSILLVTFIASLISFMLNFFFKKCDKWLKLSSIISNLLIISFVPLYYIMFDYLKNTYLINFSSTYVFTIINIIFVLTTITLTLISYSFKSKFKLIRIIEISSLLIFIITTVSMFISQYSDKSFILLNFITLLFSEYFIVNSNEELKNKTSKIIFLTTNILISMILIICLLSLIIKISFKFDLTLALIGLFVLIIALIPLLTAYKTLKKEKNND